MPNAFFVSDLHGRRRRYAALFAAVADERPDAVFLGGDLFPHVMAHGPEILPSEGFGPEWRRLRDRLGAGYPAVFLVLGNDDPASMEPELASGQAAGLWRYVHRRRETWSSLEVLGYNCVPPTPFLLKDWERYDVSRFVDPGCLSPEEGMRTDGMTRREVRLATIKDELAEAAGAPDLDRTICLFHSPPYDSHLDRAALDGRMVDHAPLDVHVGSLAIQEFIARRQPLVTLHGHVHESARLTGQWRQRFGRTHAFTAAHDGPELALVRFDPDHLEDATRELI